MLKIDVSFPGLGIGNMTLNPVALTIGNFNINWYAIIITLGMILAVTYVILRAKKIGIDYEEIIDFSIFVIPLGVMGARLYYFISEIKRYDSFWDLFKIHEGGLAIYGGIIAGTLTVFVICKIKKISFLALGDCTIPGVIMAQSIGRWGNFINGEAYGGVTSLPWRMCGSSFANTLLGDGVITAEQYQQMLAGELGVHPTFLYESLWNLIGFIGINIFYKHKRYDGEIVFLMFGWYGLGRALIEGLRTDSLYIGNTSLRISQVLAIVIFAVCLGLLIFFFIKPPKKPLYFREKKEKVRKKK